MLSTDTIARVILNIGSLAADAASFDTGLLIVKPSSWTDAKRLRAYSSSADATAGMVSDGFAVSSDEYKAAVRYFSASPAPGKLYVGGMKSNESLSDALDAILDLTTDFYGVLPIVTGLTTANWLDFVAAVEANARPLMLFVPITGTASAAVAADSLLDKLCIQGSRRVVPFFCAAAYDAAVLMGTAMGLERKTGDAGGSFTLCYKPLNALEPSDLTQAQVDAIEEKNGNVYVVRGYTHVMLEKGTTASGQRYDEVLYLDQISDALESSAVAMLAENDQRMPQTDETSALFINRFSSILSAYADRGILATGIWRGTAIGPLSTGDIIENGFLLWVDSYDLQTDADRAAHKGMPIHVALNLSGSVESIVISVNVNL